MTNAQCASLGKDAELEGYLSAAAQVTAHCILPCLQRRLQSREVLWVWSKVGGGSFPQLRVKKEMSWVPDAHGS